MKTAHYSEHVTHLGGELANLAWEDLTPHELTLSCAGAPYKGAAIAILATEQAEAATQFGDKAEAAAYQEVHDFLSTTARLLR